MSNNRDTSGNLRRRGFSGSDQFMQCGHQIINTNRAGPRRMSADWARSDEKIRKLLLVVFPKMATDHKQRERGGIWARVIHLYFRTGMSYGDVAAEMNLSTKKIRDVLQSISRAIKGLPCNGAKKRRKRSATETSLGAS